MRRRQHHPATSHPVVPLEPAQLPLSPVDDWCWPSARGDGLARLVPPEVALAMVDPTDAEPLYAAEEEAVSRATLKRRQDFRAGRAAARSALRQLGVADVGIPRGADGLPRWPDGFVGSISHCPGRGGAAVARVTEVAAVGLDIEVRRRVHSRLVAAVSTPRERAWMSASGTTLEAATLVFSAKEAVYKCVYPVMRARLAFADVEIVADLSSGDLAATLPAQLPPAWRRLAGRFAFFTAHVATSFWVYPTAVDG